MKVGIICIHHECNTFVTERTKLEDFKSGILLRGEEIRDKYQDAAHEVSGFFQGLAKEGIEAVPLFMAQTNSTAIILDATFDELWKMVEEELQRAGPLDGILAAPHGAAISESYPDLEGHWLGLLRKYLGPGKPMICTLDPHTNLSEKKISACNATIVYRTNPHIDQKEIGMEAAQLMGQTLRGEIKPVQAAAFPPMVLSMDLQATSEMPCRLMFDYLDDMRKKNPEVLSNSFVLGFPYSDIQEMGSGLIVVTNNNLPLAKKLVKEAEAFLLSHKNAFLSDHISVEDALKKAASLPKPVCLLDMGDNIGAGTPGDETSLLFAMAKNKDQRSFIALYDPEAFSQAKSAGVGKKIRLKMGGKSKYSKSPPFESEVTVKSFHDGPFQEHKLCHGGRKDYNMGPTAIVTSGENTTIMLTSQKVPPFSIQQIVSSDLDPKKFDMIVAKGVHGPVASYREYCPTFIRVNSPGEFAADITTLPFKNRKRPLFPFEK